MLLTLPNELLKHVAAFLPFSALLQLELVNRRLHIVCNDDLVLRNIAKNALYNTPGAMKHLLQRYSGPDRAKLEPKQLEWHEGNSLIDKASLRKASKLAFAVERCIAAALAENDDWTLRITPGTNMYDLVEWLPQLLMLRHPATLGLEPDVFLRIQGEMCREDRLQERENHANVNLVLVYTTLQRLHSTRSSDEVLELFRKYFHETDMSYDDHRSTFNMIKLLCERVPGYDRNLTTYEQALAVLLPLICGHVAAYPEVGLPKPDNISFHTLMDIPPVYENSAMNFTTCHLRKMTSPEFLTGRWTGFFTDKREHSWEELHPIPMDDIRFVASYSRDTASGSTYTSIDRQSGGLDFVGDFTLTGRVFDDGMVRIAKTYINQGFTWTWTGHLTPFGIVGIWGDGPFFGGYIYLYKKEWC